MLDLILTLKFVHLIAVAVLFGAWLCIALFMLLAHRSGNTSVVALTTRFVVRSELVLTAPAGVLLPLSGLPLAWAIGVPPFDEPWVVASLAIYAAMVAVWIALLIVELRMRNLTREAAVNGVPLPDAYRRLFRFWCALAAPLLAGLVAVMALMVWQPQWS